MSQNLISTFEEVLGDSQALKRHGDNLLHPIVPFLLIGELIRKIPTVLIRYKAQHKVDNTLNTKK